VRFLQHCLLLRIYIGTLRISWRPRLPVCHQIIFPEVLLIDVLDEELTFIHPDDVNLYNAWDSRAFELQVANHELLGHGSGKLFEEYANGEKNFDPEVRVLGGIFDRIFQMIHYDAQILSPLTGKKMLVA